MLKLGGMSGTQIKTKHNDSTMSFWVTPIESTAKLFTKGEGLKSMTFHHWD